MADNNSITGSVVGKIRFSIDKKSWDNLELFQKKLTSIKRQMSNMDKTIKVQAVVRDINKVVNATVKGEQKIADNRRKIRKQDTNTSHVGVFQQHLKQQKLIARQDAQLKARGGKYDDAVEAFKVVKHQQLNSTAKMRGWKDPEIDAARAKLDGTIDQWRGQANGSIGMFRAQVNTVMRDLQVTDAVTRRSALSFKSLRQELVQLTAAYTAFSVAQNVAQTGFEFESLRASARVFAKDDAGVAEHMAFISDQAQRLGIDLQTATKEFTKFSIATQTSMSKSEQRDLFVGMSEYSRVLGLNKQDYERAFRAVQQMASKGQVYKEELTGQLGEAMGGSVQAMMRAAGYSNEKDFFKAVELGKVLTKDVLPKFSQELKNMSRAGGALDKTMESTPAQFTRFMNALTNAKLAFYDNGMDKGLSTVFSDLADIISNLNPLIKALAGLFRGAAGIISSSIKLIVTPVEILVNSVAGLWNMLGFSDGTNSKIWAAIGAGGTLLLLASRFEFIRKVIMGTNSALLLLLANLARIAIPLLMIEDVYGGLQGKVSATGAGGRFSAQNILGDSFAWMDKPLSQLVTIEVKGDEAAKFIQTTVDKGNQAKSAATQSEVSQ